MKPKNHGSLAEFKRQLTLGSKWSTYHNKIDKDMGIRPVSIVQTNAVAFKTEKGTDSWLHFPSAKDVLYYDGCFVILQDGEKMLTYKKVEGIS